MKKITFSRINGTQNGQKLHLRCVLFFTDERIPQFRRLVKR